MKQFNIDPKEDNTFAQSAAVSIDAPDDYKKYAYRHLKEEFGMQLYSILEQCKSPAIVELFEEGPVRKTAYHEEVKVGVKVTPVRYKHVIVEIPHYQFTSKKSIWKRLADRFTRK